MSTSTPSSFWSRLSLSTKALVITVAGLLIITLAILIIGAQRTSQVSAPADATGQSSAVADDSHYLDTGAENAPTLVEFLDFECEVCGAVYPYMEQLREQYAGDINYVVRYFPIPGHKNSMNAAIAVEAAAQQGRFEDMYHRMFETQAEWGERQDSEHERFRTFADDLGLDMVAYDAAVAAPATAQRVQADFDAGLALGVTGTPSFFVDGTQVQVSELTDLTDALDAALSTTR